MLVIEGVAGKSLEVAKHIGTLNDDVLVITNDRLTLNSMNAGKGNMFYVEMSSIEDIKKVLEMNFKFKHVVFYQNVKREDIRIYKEIEDLFSLKAVLTVQTPDRENPREVTKYTV